MSDKKILDVRGVDKIFRKKMVLNIFADLKENQQLELISDHSLAPLNRLFQKEKHGFFIWSDLENGPELWRISIQKTGSFNLTINDILKQFPLAIDILEENRIPYFKYGNRKLNEVFKDVKSIYEEIKISKQPLVNPLRTDRWSISFTVDYIINNHHSFVKDMIPELETLIDHLVEAHSATHPQLPMIKESFLEFKEELIDHLKDEEQVVFPSYKKLERQIKGGKITDIDSFNDVITWMEEDHVLTGTSLKTMRNYCNNYVAPTDSSPGFIILFEELKKFEQDMHFHIHLENNILFTKVVNALKSLSAKQTGIKNL